MPFLDDFLELPPKKAIKVQKSLAQMIVRDKRLGKAETVAGVHYHCKKGSEISCASVAVLKFSSLELIEFATACAIVRYPYISGLLVFREGPLILEAFDKLQFPPDLVIFNGQGLSHPRRLGLASHLGLILDIASIGCAKTRLCGDHGIPGIKKGCRVPLKEGGDVIGAVVRTRSGVKPLYISVGHKIDLESAIKIVLVCCTQYRFPESIRIARRMGKIAVADY